MMGDALCWIKGHDWKSRWVPSKDSPMKVGSAWVVKSSCVERRCRRCGRVA